MIRCSTNIDVQHPSVSDFTEVKMLKPYIFKRAVCLTSFSISVESVSVYRPTVTFKVTSLAGHHVFLSPNNKDFLWVQEGVFSFLFVRMVLSFFQTYKCAIYVFSSILDQQPPSKTVSTNELGPSF